MPRRQAAIQRSIISHPDAGKTTLTEKLLLFGGAINLAGQVKAKGERRNTRSDWMKIDPAKADRRFVLLLRPKTMSRDKAQ